MGEGYHRAHLSLASGGECWVSVQCCLCPLGASKPMNLENPASSFLMQQALRFPACPPRLKEAEWAMTSVLILIRNFTLEKYFFRVKTEKVYS